MFETGAYASPRLNYANDNGFLADIYAYAIAPYCDNGPVDSTFAGFYDGASIEQIMSITQAWFYDIYPTNQIIQNYQFLKDSFGSAAPKLCFYEGGIQAMGLSTNGASGTLGARSRAVARDPMIYDIYQNMMKQWSPYVSFFMHFNIDGPPYQSNNSGDPSYMWGVQNSYKDNRGRGTGRAPSTFANRSSPDSLGQIEAVAALALSDWNTMGGSGGSGGLLIDWFGMLGD